MINDIKKIECFEGVRAYAIALIVFSHMFPVYEFAGAAGVSVFIFLSGWLS